MIIIFIIVNVCLNSLSSGRDLLLIEMLGGKFDTSSKVPFNL